MSFWRNLLDRGRSGSIAHFTPRVTYLGAPEVAALLDPMNMTAVQMWDTQPHFRTVVSFLARNVAQLGVHTFERDGESRVRARDSLVAQVLDEVDGQMTTYDLIYALVGDLALYDQAYWLVVQNTNTTVGWTLRRLPPTWVTPVSNDAWYINAYDVQLTKDGGATRIPADNILAFTGYHPTKINGASPAVNSLRETLHEQVEASKYRSQVWKRGGRVSAVIERPAHSPPWSDAGREAFREDWYAKYTGNGSMAGGTPILEDGMSLKRIDFTAQEQQFVESAKLSLRTVAGAFHVNPTMIGDNEGANYSNVREFRKMLYGDTLGPLLAQIEARLNRFLIPKLGEDRRRYYVEFNIEEKLQGNFEEQAISLQASVGAPWMTRNEARAIRNLPAVPGGDEIITPLNVLTGGQASPRDAGTQNRASRGQIASTKAAGDEDEAAEVFRKFFRRQRRVISSRLGSKAPDWWDQERWDDELAADLFAFSVRISQQVGKDTLANIGISPDRYNVDQTKKFLQAVAERVANQVNTVTLEQLTKLLDEGESPDDAVSHVYEIAEDTRAEQSGNSALTAAVAFGVLEAGRQSGRSRVRKRWEVNSGNPRASHAAMDGEEVGIDEEFSNGLPFPGSYGDPDEVAGCTCSVSIIIDD